MAEPTKPIDLRPGSPLRRSAHLAAIEKWNQLGPSLTLADEDTARHAVGVALATAFDLLAGESDD